MGLLDDAPRLARHHAFTVAAVTVAVWVVLAWATLAPTRPATVASLAYLGIEAATFLLELNWVWNLGSCTTESYAAMMGLAKLSVGAVLAYSVLAYFLLESPFACFLLLVLAVMLREGAHEAMHHAKDKDVKARLARGFLCGGWVALACGGLLVYGYALIAWALTAGRPLADEVLCAVLMPVLRLFVQLSVQQYLARALLTKGLLDALTLYADLSFAVHLAVAIPFYCALAVFASPGPFVLAVCVTVACEVAYLHALAVLQARDPSLAVTFAAQRSPSVFGAMLSGYFRGGEGETLVSNRSGVTASTAEKECIRPMGDRLQAVLEEYHELNARLKEAPLIWAVQEQKTALQAHTMASWGGVASALIAVLLLTRLVGHTILLRFLALAAARLMADAALYAHLARAVPEGFPWATRRESVLVLTFRALAAVAPCGAVLYAF